MRLLIVDDEYVSIQAITCLLNWEKIGFSSVMSASVTRQAKEIFEQYEVDLMLCDIEMPQGNGIELLSWVRDNYPKTECIFLTCHANFQYAQKAIELGSLDYLLKPITAERLEVAVKQAIKKISFVKQAEAHNQSGLLWDKHKHYIIERFWLDLFERKIISTPSEIGQAANSRNIDSYDGLKFIPILVNIKKWHEKMEENEETRMEFAIKNIAKDKIIRGEKNGLIIEIKKGKYIGIINQNDEDKDNDILKRDCENFINECLKYFLCDICCYIGKACFIHQMLDEVATLFDKDKHNVAFFNDVFLPKSRFDDHGEPKVPDMNLWVPILNNGLKDKLKCEVSTYLDNLVKENKANRDVLTRFQQDLLQMLYEYLRQNNIQAHKLFSDIRSEELFQEGTSSIRNMKVWVEYVIDKSCYFIDSVKESQSVLDKVKQYIAMHINDEISRENLAQYVFLNADYLTRMFRKSTGITLTEYILSERVKIAKELLLTTKLSISAIAAQVGYQNSGHFTRAFKKEVHVSPSEFRNR